MRMTSSPMHALIPIRARFASKPQIPGGTYAARVRFVDIRRTGRAEINSWKASTTIVIEGANGSALRA